MVLLDELGDQSGPTGLVARADPGAVVAVEVFVERDQIAPVRVVLEFFSGAENWSSLIGIDCKKMLHQPPRDFPGDLPKRHHLVRNRWGIRP